MEPTQREIAALGWLSAVFALEPGGRQGPGLMEPTQREIAALGWLSAELAGRADAWNGNAPPWFPEPPEWLELWERALAATVDLEKV